LNSNGYASWGFERADLEGGAYGGKSSADEVLKNDPFIFFHGNSDIAVGLHYWQVGFTSSLNYFRANGYSKGELYVTTWGPGNTMMAS